MSVEPASERDRLRALARQRILDSAPEREFDEITRLAALLLDAPSAAISLIDDHRQWFKARTGIDFTETPRDQAFCAHAVEDREFLEVLDAAADPRFADNPLVTCDGGIRFYAGAPLILEGGQCLGTLCVFDGTVRAPLSAQERRALEDLAQLAVERIAQRSARIAGEIAINVVTATSDAVLAVGHDGRITFWNPAAERMFGYPARQAIGEPLDLILPRGAQAAAHHRGFARAIAGGEAALIGKTVELQARRASDEEFPIELSLARWNGEGRDGDGGFAAIVRDIADRKALEQDRASARAFLNTIIDTLPAMLFVKDSATRRYLLLNKAGEALIGRAADEVVGATDRDLFPTVGDAYHDRDTSVLNAAGAETFESVFPRADGRNVTLRTKRIVVDAPHAAGKYILGLTEDVTDLRQTEARVLYLGRHDSLTGLFNRTHFVDRLEALVTAAAPFAVVTIGLDRFKAINDQFGHLTGDRLLIAVGNRLRRLVAADDLVARIGGDEFTIIVAGAGAGAGAAARAKDIAKAVVASLGEPYAIDEIVAHSGASLGIVVAPDDGDTVEALRQAADLALDRAKALGRGTISFFSAALDEAATDRRTLEADLRKAIDDRAIGVAYQPIVSTATGEISSFEALARWTHPERGPIGPDVFIAIAEECGLIGELGAQVLEIACSAAVTWRDEIRIAVNLSPMQLDDPGLVGRISGVLAQTGLAANRLQLEVTEGSVIRDVDSTFRILSELRALGIQILMDDFGVGYSSLSYFERFPFDKVKIDRSFVNTLATSLAAKAVIEAVVGLGKALGMGIVAEGVETDEQMRLLTTLGCTHLQGYLFSEPRPAEAFAALARRAARPVPAERRGFA